MGHFEPRYSYKVYSYKKMRVAQMALVISQQREQLIRKKVGAPTFVYLRAICYRTDMLVVSERLNLQYSPQTRYYTIEQEQQVSRTINKCVEI